MKAKKKGCLIVFEGIDGTGKSTQLELLASWLRQHGNDVVTTCEPTYGPFGKQIRALYQNRGSVSREQELELFLADRREHVAQIILPSIDDGKIVLCDRYFLSTAAYQGAAGFDPHYIIKCNQFAPDPDIALIFEIDISLSILRITEKRGDSLNDFEQIESLKKVDRIFREMKQSYIRRIDATGTIEEIHQLVRNQVMRIVNKSDATSQQNPHGA